MKLFIDIVMKRIYLFNIVASKLQKENRISGLQKGKFRRPSSAPEARKERSCQSYSASHIKCRHLIPSTKLTSSSHKTFHFSYMKFLDEMFIKVKVSSIFKEKYNSG